MEKLTIRRFFLVKGVPVKLLLLYPIILALISRQRDLKQVSNIDSSAAIQVLFTLVVFIFCVRELVSNSILRILIQKSPLKWFLLYIVLSLLSALWSLDVRMTLYRSFENLSFLLLIASSVSILYRRLRSIDLIVKWVLYYAILLIIAGTLKRVLLWGLPLFSIETILLEQMNSTPFFFLALLLPIGIYLRGVILPISIFSLSNTAYFGMFLGSLTLGRTNKKIRFSLAVLAVILTIFTYTRGFDNLLQQTFFYGKNGVGVEYTSGRNKIFQLAFDEGLKRPFLGYGFVAGDTYIINKEFEGAIGAHNGFLSAFLGTGIIGFLIFIIFFIKTLLMANSKYIPSKYRTAFFASAILIMVYTLGNPGLGTRVYGSWLSSTIILTMISMIFLHYKKQAK